MSEYVLSARTTTMTRGHLALPRARGMVMEMGTASLIGVLRRPRPPSARASSSRCGGYCVDVRSSSTPLRRLRQSSARAGNNTAWPAAATAPRQVRSSATAHARKPCSAHAANAATWRCRAVEPRMRGRRLLTRRTGPPLPATCRGGYNAGELGRATALQRVGRVDRGDRASTKP